MKTKYDIISPDGFSIRGEPFSSKKQAEKYFNLWKKRFEFQGYYSSCNGRIALDELEGYCRLVEIN